VTDTSERLVLPCGDVSLIGDAWGDPAAPPVLLLHGGGQTRHAWGGTARALAARGWRAVAVDLRGHGDSSWSPDGVYGLAPFVADVRYLANDMADTGTPAVLVGASLGGLASLVALGEAPHAPATALVLVDVVPRMEPEGVDRIKAFMTQAPDGFADLEEAADAVAAYLHHRARPDDLSGLRKNLRQRPDGRWVWHWDPQFMTQGQRHNEFDDLDRLATAARAITVPTLLVRGGISDVVSADGAQELKALIPHARLVDVAGAGHMVAGDRNDRFSEAVLMFLDSLRRT
jgi:pimeloyl-ACP methyl ester carboxylesterase